MSGYNQKWLNRLSQRYAYHKIKQDLDANHFFIDSEREENGEIFIECRPNFS